ncbi:hypothetical protein TRFO_39575 [Tritrichomonas foetus]|uniref:Uncharacterized protein n=1 Tax=Tritrichomonas foetus TaxID=1144522 RepID=A0A1J4J9X5_9EUKA|nr:hypothetical protein TRFO_39575 [Tritrichomonas foetus]|eukprot:OHS94245.1 hypothetical protein TRFO_39575 [Tritrichomonas foetus]
MASDYPDSSLDDYDETPEEFVERFFEITPGFSDFRIDNNISNSSDQVFRIAVEEKDNTINTLEFVNQNYVIPLNLESINPDNFPKNYHLENSHFENTKLNNDLCQANYSNSIEKNSPDINDSNQPYSFEFCDDDNDNPIINMTINEEDLCCEISQNIISTYENSFNETSSCETSFNENSSYETSFNENSSCETSFNENSSCETSFNETSSCETSFNENSSLECLSIDNIHRGCFSTLSLIGNIVNQNHHLIFPQPMGIPIACVGTFTRPTVSRGGLVCRPAGLPVVDCEFQQFKAYLNSRVLQDSNKEMSRSSLHELYNSLKGVLNMPDLSRDEKRNKEKVFYKLFQFRFPVSYLIETFPSQMLLPAILKSGKGKFHSNAP